MGKTKGIIIVIIIIAICAFIGFYVYSQQQANEELETSITPLAEDYFTKYMSANTGSNTYKVTLKDLKNSSENYDLSKFLNCDDDTSVDITIDYKTGKVTKTKVELNCK